MGTRIVTAFGWLGAVDIVASFSRAARAWNGYETWIVDLLVLKGGINEGARAVSVLRISAVCCTLCAEGGLSYRLVD